MKKIIVFIALLISAISFACSSATPAPTLTPAPTNTPIPPTTTPTPTATPEPILGVDIPVRYTGASFQVSKVDFVGEWVIDGEAYYPTTPGDIFMGITFDVTGDLFNVPVPPESEDFERTFHVEDSFGRVDQWSRLEPSEDGTSLVIMFVVDSSARGYIFSFPNGQEIDLAPFLK